LISDGWGGIDDAMLEVYGIVPQYCGRGRPPTQPRSGKDWLYLQMVKQRDEYGRLQGVELKAIWGSKAELIELLGLSYDQFTKAVVLPQGAFADFLTDKPSDRQALLRALLDIGLAELNIGDAACGGEGFALFQHRTR
jgi:hypothetical protein